MNILFLDNDKELTALFKHLDTMEDWNISFCKNFEESCNIYDTQSIDIVIIDFILDFGKETLEYIVNKNPKQKVITMGDILECSEPKGCEYCKIHYNKIRLLKPVDTTQLIKLLKNFDNSTCKFYNNFESKAGLIKIMEDIVPRFTGASYNKEDRTITLNSDNYIIDVMQFLNKYKINFEVINDTTLQLQRQQ
ncbi:MAG: hypothetical protein KAQ94_03495 [Arcobacteraceae bacterium]|nr:hypothetical protein [Arcobacteraceae bacterium]